MCVTTRRSTAAAPEVVDAFGLDPEGVEAICFYCGHPVFHPGVLWKGVSETMYFHGGCAAEFGAHLIGDAAKCATFGG